MGDLDFAVEVYFGDRPGEETGDPYFGGAGPDRAE
jgi:hypothetical protein